MFPSVIETERLRLERFGRDAVDLLSFYEVCSADPDIEAVTEHLSWDPHAHPKETADYLDSVDERWESHETASYAVRPKDPGAAPDVSPRVLDDEYGPYAGSTGLSPDWDRQTGTLGLWLRKPFWGRGYSGERAAALLELAFERLDLELVAVTHEVGNEKSRRAIEKYVDRFGGRREGELRNFAADPDGPVDMVRYSVSQAEYRDNRPPDLEVQFHE